MKIVFTSVMTMLTFHYFLLVLFKKQKTNTKTKTNKQTNKNKRTKIVEINSQRDEQAYAQGRITSMRGQSHFS